ncbi:hypothetical protein BJX66DRAFT_292062 [Aspergillus keveii]|uniref:Uncharacterized protein n=1 Tax=Aspergillus keveii TaxID=714993 RepID=A0ABR4GLQ5_9EURO
MQFAVNFDILRQASTPGEISNQQKNKEIKSSQIDQAQRNTSQTSKAGDNQPSTRADQFIRRRLGTSGNFLIFGVLIVAVVIRTSAC